MADAIDISGFGADGSALGLPESGGEFTGAVSKLIAATLQTAGIYAQSDVLSTYRPLVESLAILLYTGALIAGILSFALFGNYRRGLYFFLGPALFWWMITATTQAGPVKQRVGERIETGATSGQLDFLQFINEGQQERYKKPATVSHFFVIWDNLISSVMQNLVALFMDTKNKADLMAVGRERMFSRLGLATSDNPGFISLVSTGVMGECAELTAISLEVSNLKQSEAKSRSIGDTTTADKLKARAGELEAQYNRRKKEDWFTPQGTVINYLQTVFKDDLTGQELESLQKLNCERTWEFIGKASLEVANQWLENIGKGDDSYIPWTQVRAEVEKSLEKGGHQAAELVAAYILKNTIAFTAHGAMTSQIFNRSPIPQDDHNLIFSNMANHEARGLHLKIVYFAAAVPYIQGLLLYLLSLTFPMFCIFLLLPGRLSAFLVWMSLWVWVKSWDVGFAFITFLSDFLWQFVNPSLDNSAPLNWQDPGSVYRVIYSSDPMAHMNTYKTIIAVLTCGVPLLTAHLCLGATDLYEAFRNTIDQTGNRFKGRMSASSAAKEANLLEKKVGDIQRRMVEEAVKKAEKEGFGETANGVSRKAHGGALLQRYIDEVSSRAGFHAQFSDEAWRVRQAIGGLRGRLMPYTFGTGKDLVSAGINHYNEQFVGRSPDAWSGNRYTGSEVGEDDSETVDIFSGGGDALGAGYDGDGSDNG